MGDMRLTHQIESLHARPNGRIDRNDARPRSLETIRMHGMHTGVAAVLISLRDQAP
jgi:predicted N-formylglutamate amidohydrolase